MLLVVHIFVCSPFTLLSFISVKLAVPPDWALPSLALAFTAPTPQHYTCHAPFTYIDLQKKVYHCGLTLVKQGIHGHIHELLQFHFWLYSVMNLTVARHLAKSVFMVCKSFFGLNWFLCFSKVVVYLYTVSRHNVWVSGSLYVHGTSTPHLVV